MRSRQILTNFRAGVLAPAFVGLIDNEFYRSGLQVGTNIMITTTGAMKRRAGSVFIRNYGDIEYMRIFPFTFNRDQKYIIAILLDNDDTGRLDIYRDDIQVAPSIVVPYNTVDKIKELNFAQSADSMIFAQGDTPAYYLRRLGDDASWDFIPVPIINPPQYDPENNEPPVLEGMWTDLLGYPKCVTFHQGRLWFAGTKTFPQNVWASKTQDFFNFDLGDQDARDSIQEALDTDFINPITAIFSARQLQLFTRGGEFTNQASVLTPSTSHWARESSYGSTFNVQPLSIDGSTIFVDSSGRTVRSFTFSEARGGYDSPSISAHAEHLVKQPQRMGIVRGDALEPANTVFIINADGTLALLNISKAHELLAWTEWTTQGLYRDTITLDREVYILVERPLAHQGEYITHESEIVTYQGINVYIDGDPADNIRFEWTLERLSDVMLVDSGSLQRNIVGIAKEQRNRDENHFFGVYANSEGKGYIVIVSGGNIIFKSDFLKNNPKEPYLNVDGTRYTPKTLFSYNESVREQYFDTELGFVWHMYQLNSLLTLDSGRNYIDGLTHLIGTEVVTSLDGNIQEPQVVQSGEGVDTVEKAYPDGTLWHYDDDNIIEETFADSVLALVVVRYEAIEYTNPTLTEYGYLIEGEEGTIGSVYIEKGVVRENELTNLFDEDFSSSGNFTVAPTETTIGICAGGAGGSGANGGFTFGTFGSGGFAGEAFSDENFTVIPKEVIPVTIGLGGAIPSFGDGNAGGSSSFGSYFSIAGGAGGSSSSNSYAGNGESKTSCGGTFTDGLSEGFAMGGEAGIHGNGGNGSSSDNDCSINAKAGGFTAGGGGLSSGCSTQAKSGKGGDGFIRVKHSVSVVEIQKSEVRKVELVFVSVSEGAILFPNQTYKVGQAGLFFPVIAQTMPLNVSAGAGSLVNEPKRIVSTTLRYKDTQGVIVNGTEMPERYFGEETLGKSPELLTGVDKLRHLGYNRDTSVVVTQNDPMPFTLLSIDIEVNY